jgi:hypothetical protein
MGWLFAVALGLQQRDRRAVWGALLPLALGHACAIATAVAVAALLGLVLAPDLVRQLVAMTLLGFGVLRLMHHRHPRWAAMRVGRGDLVLWSFLMASAHGAGLMVVPLIPAATAHHPVVDGHMQHSAALASIIPESANAGLLATLAHTAGYLSVTVLIAVLVYERLGVRILRTAWVNLDLVWSVALVVTALFTALG